jgi:hypothetical protein
VGRTADEVTREQVHYAVLELAYLNHASIERQRVIAIELAR